MSANRVYQKCISFAFFLIAIYYISLPSLDSHRLGKSRHTSDATFHLNNVPIYASSILGQILTQLYSMRTLYALLFVYCVCEVLFFFRFAYLRKYIDNNVSAYDISPSMTKQRREHLIKMAAKYATLYEGGGMRGWASLWFEGTPIEDIHYDNAVAMLKWGFHLTEEPLSEWSQRFLKIAMDCVEGITAHSFKKGTNPHISFVCNSRDDIPLATLYRPLIFYLFLLCAQCVTDIVFAYILSFEFRYENGLKIWYKLQSNSNNSKPILLVHGLGVHYMPYIPLIWKLMRKSNGKHDIFCVEIPWIVMSVKHFIPKCIWQLFSDSPSQSFIDSKVPLASANYVEILRGLEALILKRKPRNDLQLEWTFIGHSYGSLIVSGIYIYLKEQFGDINLPRLVLLDPVSLCMSQPTLISFAMLPQTDLVTFCFQQLAVRELMIACSVRKYLHWFEVALFPEDLLNTQRQHIVVSAECDTLLPHGIINKGIVLANKKSAEIGCKRINHIVLRNVHHAQWLLSMRRLQRIVDAI